MFDRELRNPLTGVAALYSTTYSDDDLQRNDNSVQQASYFPGFHAWGV
jgi:hypothetical protein